MREGLWCGVEETIKVTIIVTKTLLLTPNRRQVTIVSRRVQWLQIWVLEIHL